MFLNSRCPQCLVFVGETMRLSIDPNMSTPQRKNEEDSMFSNVNVTVYKKIGSRQNIIFATNDQLQLLSQANGWYVIVIFK